MAPKWIGTTRQMPAAAGIPASHGSSAVVDELNTHGLRIRCEAFAPETARASVARLEMDHTAKHGRWRNKAKTERSTPVSAIPEPQD